MARTHDSTKRRKSSSVETLQEAYDITLSETPVFESLHDFVRSDLVKSNFSLLLGLIFGVFKADATEVNTHIMPVAFRRFTASRDTQGKIKQLSCVREKKTLSEDRRNLAMACEGAKSLNTKFIILDKKDGNLGALFVPNNIHIVKQPDSAEEEVGALFIVYDLKRQLPIYLEPKKLQSLLKFSYITLDQVSKVVRDANQVAKSGTFPEISGLKNLQTLVKSLKELESKKKPLTFISTLVSCALATSKIEDKIKTFEESPSHTLARQLGLPSIYYGNLYTESKRQAPKVRLADLEDEDLVTMSKVPVSELEYKNFPADPSDEMVYLYTDKLGTLKSQKFVTAHSVAPMPKDLLLRFYAAATQIKGGTKQEASDDLNAGDETEGYEVI